MGKMRLVALAGAMVCAVIAGFMVLKVVGHKKPAEVKQEAATAAPRTTDVLVATKDMLLGEKLSDRSVAWKPWPRDSLLMTMITRDSKPGALKDIANARAAQSIFRDEPILDKKIVLPGAGGFMSASLPKGMRAISVAISSRSSAGGFILPNDRVDVILTRKNTDGRGGANKVTSETVVSNVRVLAVNQIYRPAEGDTVSVEKGETATLELSPKEAEIIAMVESSGELALALRSIAENDGKTADQLTPVLADRFGGKTRNDNGGEPLFVRAGIATVASAP